MLACVDVTGRGSGTIRANLDPFVVYTDEQLHSALRAVELTDFVEERGGLLGLLTENGSNASVRSHYRAIANASHFPRRHCV